MYSFNKNFQQKRFFPINEIKCIKLYYPYLYIRDKNKWSLINEIHIKYFFYYLLFVDCIILPPRDFIRKGGINNLKLMLHNKYLKFLIEHNLLITTITDNHIRDFKDLIEKETNVHIKYPYIDFKLYFRNALIQKSSYSKFLINELQKIKIKNKNLIIKRLQNKPSHSEFIKFINNTFKNNNTNEKKILKIYANLAYHLGGIKGNDAIMPPYKLDDFIGIYNPFYATVYIEKIVNLIEKKLQKNIFEDLNIFYMLYDNLRIFKYEYLYLSKKIINSLELDKYYIPYELYHKKFFNYLNNYDLYKKILLLTNYFINKLINFISLKLTALLSVSFSSISYIIEILNNFLLDVIKEFIKKIIFKIKKTITKYYTQIELLSIIFNLEKTIEEITKIEKQKNNIKNLE